jgi:type I site-specific restriction-modification system R (restriction) subunit
LVKDAAGRRFHTVLVVIDRVKLNEQVGGAVERYLRRNGVDEIFRAESIQHLSALLDGSHAKTPQRVIVTTIHKMGLLAKEPVLLARLLHRQRSRNGDAVIDGGSNSVSGEDADMYQRVAIITDEAHRSHSVSTRAAIEEVISTGSAVRPTVRK